MKVGSGENTIVIGKRVSIGAAITSIGTALAFFYPEKAVAIMALTVPVTFFIQVAISNLFSITTKEK